MREQIPKLHAAYCTLTGFCIRLAYDRERAWFDFIQDGFTLDDLTLVVAFIKAEIRSERRREASLMFRNLIVQRDRFEEDLAIAKAHSRKPVKNARDHVLEQLRPTVSQTTTTITAKPAAELIENLKRAAGMPVK